MTRTKKESVKRSDVVLLLDEYERYWTAARKFAIEVFNFKKDLTDSDQEAIFEADAKALEPAYKMWIYCTRHVNSADRWKLVTEQMIVDMLVSFRLWPKGHGRRTISEMAWAEVWGDYRTSTDDAHRPKFKNYK